MNFLAHFHLSFQNPDWLLGNGIADFTRRRFLDRYPLEVQKGIRLHHFIDEYTDQHPTVISMKRRLQKQQGKYAGVGLDILMDHLLARDFEKHTGQKLAEFTSWVYQVIRKPPVEIPAGAERTFYYMSTHDWLGSYASPQGIDRALAGMGRRAKFENQLADLRLHYRQDSETFHAGFEEFYPQLLLACSEKAEELKQG